MVETRKPNQPSSVRPGGGQTPRDITAGGDNGDTATAIRRRISEHGARTIRLAYLDAVGEPGFVFLPAADLARALAGRIAVPDSDDTVLHPDPRTLRFLPASHPGLALAHLTCDKHLPDGAPAPACGRLSLRRVGESLGKSGVVARVSFSCRLDWVPSSRLDPAALSRVLESTVTTLDGCPLPGLTAKRAAREASATISVGPLALVDAVDALTILDHAVRLAVYEHSPAGPSADLSVSRIALTVHRGRRNLFARENSAAGAGKGFLAGLRAHAAGLTALLRPALAGDVSFASGRTSAAPLADTDSWSWESGWAGPLRFAIDRNNGCLTVGGLDGSGNPYLMLTGLFVAGLDGVRAEGDDSAGVAGQEPRCPADPAAALAELEADDCLRIGIGDLTAAAYAAALRSHWGRVAH